jgi:hypothetical protein
MEVVRTGVLASGERRYSVTQQGHYASAVRAVRIYSSFLGPHCKIRAEDTDTLENGLTLDVEPDHAAGDQGAQGQEHDCSGETLLWKEQNQLPHDVKHEKAGAGIQKGPCAQRNANDDADKTYSQSGEKDGHIGT